MNLDPSNPKTLDDLREWEAFCKSWRGPAQGKFLDGHTESNSLQERMSADGQRQQENALRYGGLANPTITKTTSQVQPLTLDALREREKFRANFHESTDWAAFRRSIPRDSMESVPDCGIQNPLFHSFERGWQGFTTWGRRLADEVPDFPDMDFGFLNFVGGKNAIADERRVNIATEEEKIGTQWKTEWEKDRLEAIQKQKWREKMETGEEKLELQDRWRKETTQGDAQWRNGNAEAQWRNNNGHGTHLWIKETTYGDAERGHAPQDETLWRYATSQNEPRQQEDEVNRVRMDGHFSSLDKVRQDEFERQNYLRDPLTRKIREEFERQEALREAREDERRNNISRTVEFEKQKIDRKSKDLKERWDMLEHERLHQEAANKRRLEDLRMRERDVQEALQQRQKQLEWKRRIDEEEKALETARGVKFDWEKSFDCRQGRNETTIQRRLVELETEKQYWIDQLKASSGFQDSEVKMTVMFLRPDKLNRQASPAPCNRQASPAPQCRAPEKITPQCPASPKFRGSEVRPTILLPSPSVNHMKGRQNPDMQTSAPYRSMPSAPHTEIYRPRTSSSPVADCRPPVPVSPVAEYRHLTSAPHTGECRHLASAPPVAKCRHLTSAPNIAENRPTSSSPHTAKCRAQTAASPVAEYRPLTSLPHYLGNRHTPSSPRTEKCIPLASASPVAEYRPLPPAPHTETYRPLTSETHVVEYRPLTSPPFAENRPMPSSPHTEKCRLLSPASPVAVYRPLPPAPHTETYGPLTSAQPDEEYRPQTPPEYNMTCVPHEGGLQPIQNETCLPMGRKFFSTPSQEDAMSTPREA